jgi:hypothetical protein
VVLFGPAFGALHAIELARAAHGEALREGDALKPEFHQDRWPARWLSSFVPAPAAQTPGRTRDNTNERAAGECSW